MISKADDVTSYFGYWPQFCDGRIVSFSLSNGVVQLAVRYGDADLRKAAEVHIRFSGASEVDLNELASQNILDELSVEGEGPYVVRLEACCGINGEFKCEAVEVVEMRPYAL